MIIKPANKQDLPAINYLLNKYGKMSVSDSYINKKDVALQVREESGELIGFIWCGLMANGTIAYIDKFCIDPEYTHRGIGLLLAKYLQQVLHKRKVKSVFGLIKQDKYHDKSAMNSLRMAMGAHDASYTFVETDLLHSIKELESLGVSYGR